MKSADLSSWKCRWFLTWLLCFKGTVTHLEKYKCFTFPFCQNHKWTECICIILSAGDSFPTCQCPRRSWHVCFSSCLQAMWKPAYDFLVTWAAQIGDSYRDVIQELHMGLDKMKNPITKRWKHLTGTLILVNCLDVLRSSAFSPSAQDDYAIWTQALPHTSTPCSSGAIFFFLKLQRLKCCISAVCSLWMPLLLSFLQRCLQLFVPRATSPDRPHVPSKQYSALWSLQYSQRLF